MQSGEALQDETAPCKLHVEKPAALVTSDSETKRDSSGADSTNKSTGRLFYNADRSETVSYLSLVTDQAEDFALSTIYSQVTRLSALIIAGTGYLLMARSADHQRRSFGCTF